MLVESMQQHAQEIAAGERFSFGANRARFLELLNDKRIAVAEEPLRTMLHVKDQAGETFPGAGTGSGLFRLAARRQGQRNFPGDPNWRVEQASVLDPAYPGQFGRLDGVYSRGVLHHIGKMWDSLAKVVPMVADGGRLFIAICNDRGKPSRRWTTVKRAYCALPGQLEFKVLCPAFVFLWWRRIVKDLLLLQPFASWRDCTNLRGMSPWRDVVAWVGGYPFEVTKPEQLFHFYRDRGFVLTESRTEGGDRGCNEFVFIKKAGQAAGFPE